jgi:hypothetical protein
VALDDDEKNQAFAERINNAIAEAIGAGEAGEDTAGMPAKFVIIATYVDSSGEEATLMQANTGAKLYDTLGLLALGQAVWSDEAGRWARGE